MACTGAWESCREMPLVFLHSGWEATVARPRAASARRKPNPRRPGRGGGGCSHRQTDRHKQTENNTCWRRCGELEPSYTACMWNGAASVGNCLAVPQKRSTEWPQDPAIAHLRIHSRKLKAHLHTKVYKKCSQQWYSLQARSEKQTINWVLDQQNVVYPYNGALFGYKKERCTDPCYSIGKPGTPHAQPKEADTKGHILYDCILTTCPEQANP